MLVRGARGRSGAVFSSSQVRLRSVGSGGGPRGDAWISDRRDLVAEAPPSCRPLISTISPAPLTSVSGSSVDDVGDEGAAGGDAGGGLRLRFAAQAGVDFVGDRVLAGAHRAQLPDRLDRLARLQRAEGVGAPGRRSRRRPDRTTRRGAGRSPTAPRPAGRRWPVPAGGSWTAKGIWAASPSLPLMLTVTVSAGTVFLPVLSTSIFISEVWPTNWCGREARLGHLHLVGAGGLVGVRGRPAAGSEQRRHGQGRGPHRGGSKAGTPAWCSGPPQSVANIARGIPATEPFSEARRG